MFTFTGARSSALEQEITNDYELHDQRAGVGLSARVKTFLFLIM
jgi:hypothetical protein